jgi:hypothetical protein
MRGFLDLEGDVHPGIGCECLQNGLKFLGELKTVGRG